MICITIWIFRFFYFASQRTPKMQGQLPSFERKMPCGFRIRRRNRNDLGHFGYPPGETSQARHPSCRVCRRPGSATFDETQPGIVFLSPSVAPCVAHHRVTAGLIIGLPLVGPDRVDPSLRFGRCGRALGTLARISQIFAISCQISRALAISKTTHCIRLSTADKGQEYG